MKPTSKEAWASFKIDLRRLVAAQLVSVVVKVTPDNDVRTLAALLRLLTAMSLDAGECAGKGGAA